MARLNGEIRETNRLVKESGLDAHIDEANKQYDRYSAATDRSTRELSMTDPENEARKIEITEQLLERQLKLTRSCIEKYC